MPLTLEDYVLAVGALGTSAFALVDVLKGVLPKGGPSHIGFKFIAEQTGAALAPDRANRALSTLQSNWINGTPLTQHRQLAVSLVKLHWRPADANALARQTGLDAGSDAHSQGQDLTPALQDVDGQLNFALTALSVAVKAAQLRVGR